MTDAKELIERVVNGESPEELIERKVLPALMIDSRDGINADRILGNMGLSDPKDYRERSGIGSGTVDYIITNAVVRAKVEKAFKRAGIEFNDIGVYA